MPGDLIAVSPVASGRVQCPDIRAYSCLRPAVIDADRSVLLPLMRNLLPRSGRLSSDRLRLSFQAPQELAAWGRRCLLGVVAPLARGITMAKPSAPPPCIAYKDFSITPRLLAGLHYAEVRRQDGGRFASGIAVCVIATTRGCQSEQDAVDAARQLIDSSRAYP